MPDGPYLVQFVDSIVASPTVRLDLCNGVWILQPNSDLSPPGLRRATASTLLADGQAIPAAAYDNRVLRLVLRLDDGPVAAADTAAGHLQRLARELDRPTNILKWQPGTSNPVHFRTLRAEFDAIYWDPVQKTATVAIPAEPFGYGLPQTVTPITVSNDPAAGSNGCFFDVTGVMGDVDTPLILKRPVTNVGEQSLFAVRRRGTPSNMPFVLQAESMTQVVDTAIAADGTMSGGNRSRITFATNTTLVERLRMSTFPASSSVDARGAFRVFMRCRKNGNTSTVQVKAHYGSSSFNTAQHAGDTLTITGTAVQWVEVHNVTIPVGADPVRSLSGVEIPAEGICLILQASRTGGSDTLDIDCFLFLPADDRLAIVAWTPDGSAGTADRLILDGDRDVIYGIINATGEVASIGSTYYVGGLPMLSPGVTNRVFHLNEVTPQTAETTWPTTWSFEPFYIPRYLYVAPVGS